jgi:hypothetical protein
MSPEMAQQDNLLPKIKFKRRRKTGAESQQINKGGFDAYFNYLPFEKAVIESKGRTPFTNREVEIISQTHQALSSRQRLPTPGAVQALSTGAPRV